ncbi:MAG: helix-turn-helix transcriptional regulator [Lachnospiraceae bacterium]|nr:helix-turn-helix transcriptional regulator [Lachnospiraceae bacterium]MBR4082748.1 helix-turn-helix transcriptional regulator [Lachnospiraceae bacterium]
MKYRTEYDLKVIGKNLKRLREQHHLTVEQLREYLCLGSVQAIYKYEAGVGYPQADTMLALMELYGVGVNDIVKSQEGELSSPSCCILGIFTKISKKVTLNVVFPNKSLVYK